MDCVKAYFGLGIQANLEKFIQSKESRKNTGKKWSLCYNRRRVIPSFWNSRQAYRV